MKFAMLSRRPRAPRIGAGGDGVRRSFPGQRRSWLLRTILTVSRLSNSAAIPPRGVKGDKTIMILHGYFRSSASYRVRIALNMKGLMARHISHHLRKGEQRAADYLLINAQGFVPTLITDAGSVLTQSMAILEWLEETHPNPPLLPREPVARAHVRAFAYAIACDIHPVQNLKVIARVRQLAGEYGQNAFVQCGQVEDKGA